MEEQLPSRNDALVFRTERLLRFSIIFVFWYAAYRSFLNPTSWVGFVPAWMGSVAEPERVLEFFSVGQITVGFWLLVGWKLRAAAIVAALFVVGIVLSNLGAFDIVFRDVTIIFAALALAVLAGYKKQIPADENIL